MSADRCTAGVLPECRYCGCHDRYAYKNQRPEYAGVIRATV
jgi:hypothetical protein